MEKHAAQFPYWTFLSSAELRTYVKCAPSILMAKQNFICGTAAVAKSVVTSTPNEQKGESRRRMLSGFVRFNNVTVFAKC
jgi:hypothetical protein